MNVTAEPDIVTWPEAHYVFLERVGQFPGVAIQAWEDVQRLEPAISMHNQITGAMALYKIGPNVYRAGFRLSTPGRELPQDVQYARIPGGRYSRFVSTGPYSNLPEACGRVWSIVTEKQIPLRDDFAIENYVNDPKKTPEEQLITEILVPTA